MIAPKHAASSQDVALHYGELDSFYREIWGEHVHHGLWLSGAESVDVAVRQLVDLVAAEADVQPGTRVCDVGSGYGGTARHLVLDYGADVTAVTISRAQYDHAQTLSGSYRNPRHLCCDWLENDLPDASFDVVTAIECASHMTDKERFVREAFRVLRPGGRFVFCAWLASEHPRAWQVRGLLEPICREGRLPGLGTASEYCSWVERAGFELRGFTDLSRNVRRTWSVCIQRTARQILSNPRYVRYLTDRQKKNRSFALAIARLWAAYRTGAMRYGLFKARKPLYRLRDAQ